MINYARRYKDYYERKSIMKKYELLLDKKFTVIITAQNEEKAIQKARLYGGSCIEIIGEQ